MLWFVFHIERLDFISFPLDIKGCSISIAELLIVCRCVFVQYSIDLLNDDQFRKKIHAIMLFMYK